MKFFNSILFFLLPFTINAQRKFQKLEVKDPPPLGGYSKKIVALEKENHNCARFNPISFADRMKMFPFSDAAKIQFVSFDGFSIPKSGNDIDTSQLKEIRTLTQTNIDSLSDIIYNVGFSGSILLIEEVQCFVPVNAILFNDLSGKTFAYIEVCFACQNYISLPDYIGLGDICNQKFDLLKRLFSRVGIRHGLDQE